MDKANQNAFSKSDFVDSERSFGIYYM